MQIDLDFKMRVKYAYWGIEWQKDFWLDWNILIFTEWLPQNEWFRMSQHNYQQPLLHNKKWFSYFHPFLFLPLFSIKNEWFIVVFYKSLPKRKGKIFARELKIQTNTCKPEIFDQLFGNNYYHRRISKNS